MNIASELIKIYILFTLILLHIIHVIFNNEFLGNVFSPIVCIYSLYIIYSTIKNKPKNSKDKTHYFLFVFIFIWAIADTFWFVAESLLKIDVKDTPIPYIYTLSSIILALLAVYLYRTFYKKLDVKKLLFYILTISSVLIFLIWSFIISNSALYFEPNVKFFNITIFMFGDFISLALFILLYFSFKNQRNSISFNLLLLGSLIYVLSNLYFAYLEFNNYYYSNLIIDGNYTLVCSLFALSVYSSKSNFFSV